MKKPNILVLSGYGLNCEEEARYAFEVAGGSAKTIHINDVIGYKNILGKFQILVIPGGFSFGDDLGSGLAFGGKMRNYLWEELMKFINRDTLILGICNGFQVLVNLGLLPALDGNYGERSVALLHNQSVRYTDRWVDLKVSNSSPWLRKLTSLCFPIAHGEGKFYASKDILNILEKKKLIALRYFKGEVSTSLDLSANPNGSMDDIAGLTDVSGRILGLMPHPDRAVYAYQHPLWHRRKEKLIRLGRKLPYFGDGYYVFKNAVGYFS